MSASIDDTGRRASVTLHHDLHDLDVDAALSAVLAAAALDDDSAAVVALDLPAQPIARRRWHAVAGVAAAILLIGAGIASVSRASDSTILAGPRPASSPGPVEPSTPPRALVEVVLGPIVVAGVSFASVPEGFQHYHPGAVEVTTIGRGTRLTIVADDGRAIEVYVEAGVGANDAIGNKVGSATKEGDDNVVRWEEPGGTAVELRSSSVSLAELHTMAIMARAT